MSAAYAGIKNIYLKTFSKTYAPINAPWTWNYNALQPMEFAGAIRFIDPFFTAQGFSCRVFDSGINAFTTFTYGDITTGLINNNFGNILWKRLGANSGTLKGWVFGIANSLQPLNFSSYVTLGVDVTTNLFSTTNLFNCPSAMNSGVPDPGAGQNSANWYDSDGFIFSTWRNNFVQSYMQWDGFTTVSQLGTVICNFGATKRFTGMIPYNTNYVWCEDSTGTGTKTLVVTNFIGSSHDQAPVLINPNAPSIDLNAYINALATPSPSPCYKGWLWMNKNALTVDGIAFNGFGIYVMPDFSSYYLLQIIPIDSYAANWNTGAGTVYGKFDDKGALWLHDTSSATDIFVSVPPPSYVPPVNPPIGLPCPPHDSDRFLTGMEGTGL